MRAYWRLPESLQVAAYSCDGEYAWPRQETLLVIQHLSERGLAVIGIEVWLATEPGPTIPSPGIYAWEAPSRHEAESWSAFAPGANAKAADYVRTFSWNPNDLKHASEIPFFNLTIVEDGD